MALPQMTEEQRKAALAKAKKVRADRAKIREKLAAGKMSLKDVFKKAAGDPTYGKMRITYVLRSLPGVGKVTVENTLNEIGIDEKRRVGGLGSRQQEALLEKFGK